MAVQFNNDAWGRLKAYQSELEGGEAIAIIITKESVVDACRYAIEMAGDEGKFDADAEGEYLFNKIRDDYQLEAMIDESIGRDVENGYNQFDEVDDNA